MGSGAALRDAREASMQRGWGRLAHGRGAVSGQRGGGTQLGGGGGLANLHAPMILSQWGDGTAWLLQGIQCRIW